MSAPEAVPARRRVVVVRRRPVADAAPAPVVASAPVNGADVSPAAPADGAEPLGDRVWRQVRDGGIDRDRLLPSLDKRRRDLTKRMDKPMDRNGWRMFAAGCAYTIEHGKGGPAAQRRDTACRDREPVECRRCRAATGSPGGPARDS